MPDVPSQRPSTARSPVVWPGATRTPGQWDSRPLDPNVTLRQMKAVELADPAYKASGSAMTS
jgi:hypothetical protein